MPRGKAWTEYEDNYLIERYPKTKTREISEHLGRSMNAVNLRARKLDLNKETAKHDYFKEWSPNMAYILGLIYADGCLVKDTYRVDIVLHNDDEYMLYAIRNELQATSNVKRQGRSNCNYLSFHSPTIYQDLLDIGLFPNKTYTIEMPNVPDEFLCDFMRGFFDGDGTIVQSKDNPRINITGASKQMFIQLEGQIERVTGITGRINKKPSDIGTMNYRLYYNGLNALDLAKWMYSNTELNSLYLTRKHDIYVEYESLYRDKYMKRVEEIQSGTPLWNTNKKFVESTSRYYSEVIK